VLLEDCLTGFHVLFKVHVLRSHGSSNCGSPPPGRISGGTLMKHEPDSRHDAVPDARRGLQPHVWYTPIEFLVPSFHSHSVFTGCDHSSLFPLLRGEHSLFNPFYPRLSACRRLLRRSPLRSGQLGPSPPLGQSFGPTTISHARLSCQQLLDFLHFERFAPLVFPLSRS